MDRLKAMPLLAHFSLEAYVTWPRFSYIYGWVGCKQEQEEKKQRPGNGGGQCGPLVTNNVADEIAGVYDDCFRGIYGYCVRRLYSKDQAEDAASAVFLRLVEEYGVLRHKSSKGLRNWLYGTANNVIARYFRDARRHREIVAAVTRERQALSFQGVGGDDRLDWPVLYEAIARLEGRHQEMVVLRYFQGLETSAIAKILGMRHVTVRVGLSRAVKKLQSELERRFGVLHEEG